ncbi:MAG: F0F1 ATP synthase subunit B [Gammaproteobacteria bacterium]|nr:F0F1 ATP synthase subunit B [Gammaproteobacteria bacterium]
MDLNATIIGQTIAMVLFVWFCMRFVWPLIMNMIEERQTQIADGLAAAEEGSRSLEKAEVKIAGMIDEARTQGRDIVDEANTRGSGIVDEARVEAGRERERIVTAAHAEVEQEVNRAREELRGQVASIAVAGAARIIAKEIDAATHKGLLDKLAAEI